LLDDVHQLMAEEPPSQRGIGVVLSRSEVDVSAVRERCRSKGRGMAAHMDANVGETRPEERLHPLPDRGCDRHSSGWKTGQVRRKGERRLRLGDSGLPGYPGQSMGEGTLDDRALLHRVLP
jgi:hypothetical protein